MLGFPSPDSPNFQGAKNISFREEPTFLGKKQHIPPLEIRHIILLKCLWMGFFLWETPTKWDWKHQIIWTFSLSQRLVAPPGPATPWRPCRLAGAWAAESAPSPRCGAVGVRRCTGARWVGEVLGRRLVRLLVDEVGWYELKWDKTSIYIIYICILHIL